MENERGECFEKNRLKKMCGGFAAGKCSSGKNESFEQCGASVRRPTDAVD